MIWGGELVLRDGVAVGQVTSGAWGETLGACVGLAYVRHPDGEVLTPDLVRAGEYQVNVAVAGSPGRGQPPLPRSTRRATGSGAAIYPERAGYPPPRRSRARPDRGRPR